MLQALLHIQDGTPGAILIAVLPTQAAPVESLVAQLRYWELPPQTQRDPTVTGGGLVILTHRYFLNWGTPKIGGLLPSIF